VFVSFFSFGRRRDLRVQLPLALLDLASERRISGGRNRVGYRLRGLFRKRY
jgi:hypothetical protein